MARPDKGNSTPKFVHPPFSKTVAAEFPTPLVEDVVVVVAKEANTPSYQVVNYGTAHPDTNKYPNHKLVHIQLSDDGLRAKWFYVADRDDQDLYNFALKYRSEHRDSPIYIRQYVLPRKDYAPLDNLTPDSVDTDALLVHEEVLGPADGELAGLYIKVVRVFEVLPGPALISTVYDKDGVSKTISKQRVFKEQIVTGETLSNNILTRKYGEAVDDVVSEQVEETIVVDDDSLLDTPAFTTSIENVIPLIFRAQIPTHIVSHIVEGVAAQPDLEIGEFERSERQLHPLYKEVRYTVLDDIGTIPITISGIKETNAAQQVVDVTMVLEYDSTPATEPTATIEVDFKKLGNGLAIETRREVPEVFDSDQFAKSIPDAIPLEFRALLTTETEAHRVEGTASMPALGVGELEHSEQQETEFIKRTSVTSRDISELPKTLTDKETSAVKQTVTVDKTLEDEGASLAIPSATQDVSVHNLGNGLEIEEVRSVDELFDPKRFTKSVPDVTPIEFRAALKTLTEEHVVEGDAAEPTLLTSELERSEEQVNEFVKRTSVTSRDPDTIPSSLVDTETSPEKQVITVTKTIEDEGTSTTTPDATTTVQVRNLGNGLEVEEVRSVPDVFGQEEFNKEISDVTPSEFKAAIPVTTTATTAAGTASAPSLSSGDLRKTDEQVDEFRHRASTTHRDLSSLPQSIVSKKTSAAKQVVTVTKTLEADSTTPATPTAVRDVTFEKLGDGTAVETVEDVPSVFSRAEYGAEIPDAVPLPFRVAVPTTTTATTAAGTASAPTLSTGDLRKTDEQVDSFVHRSSTTHRSAASYPTALASTKLTPQGQVETVTQTLDNSIQSVTGAATTVEADVQNLGDGTSLKTVGTVPDVFGEDHFEIAIPDVIPVEFRVAVPTTVTEETTAGTAAPPTLATGDLSKSEQQVTKFKKRTRTETRSGIVLPVTLTNKELTSEFGGGTTSVIRTLAFTGTSAVDEGLEVLRSSVKNLGNGTELKETQKLPGVSPSWPTLTGSSFDKEMQVFADEEDQIVDPSYTPASGTYFVESLKPVDQWRSKRSKLIRTPTAISLVTALVEEVDGPYQFPGLVYLAPGGGGYYRRQASAQLCQHVLRTWWLSSATKPTRGLPGSAMDVEVQDIIMDEIIISSLNNVTTLEYSGMVLHDAITTFGVLVYAATTPSATAYTAMIGTEIVTAASIEQTDIPELWKIQTKSVVAR